MFGSIRSRISDEDQPRECSRCLLFSYRARVEVDIENALFIQCGMSNIDRGRWTVSWSDLWDYWITHRFFILFINAVIHGSNRAGWRWRWQRNKALCKPVLNPSLALHRDINISNISSRLANRYFYQENFANLHVYYIRYESSRVDWYPDLGLGMLANINGSLAIWTTKPVCLRWYIHSHLIIRIFYFQLLSISHFAFFLLEYIESSNHYPSFYIGWSDQIQCGFTVLIGDLARLLFSPLTLYLPTKYSKTKFKWISIRSENLCLFLGPILKKTARYLANWGDPDVPPPPSISGRCSHKCRFIYGACRKSYKVGTCVWRHKASKLLCQRLPRRRCYFRLWLSGVPSDRSIHRAYSDSTEVFQYAYPFLHSSVSLLLHLLFISRVDQSYHSKTPAWECCVFRMSRKPIRQALDCASSSPHPALYSLKIHREMLYTVHQPSCERIITWHKFLVLVCGYKRRRVSHNDV